MHLIGCTRNWSAVLAVALLMALLPARKLHAAENSSIMQVSVEIKPSCRVRTSPLVFPAQEGMNAVVTAETAVFVDCGSAEAFSVSIDQGLHADGSYRRLSLNGNGPGIPYDIYADAGYTKSWAPNTVYNYSLLEGVDNRRIDIYARAVIGEAALQPGTYTDELVITVTF